MYTTDLLIVPTTIANLLNTSIVEQYRPVPLKLNSLKANLVKSSSVQSSLVSGSKI